MAASPRNIIVDTASASVVRRSFACAALAGACLLAVTLADSASGQAEQQQQDPRESLIQSGSVPPANPAFEELDDEGIYYKTSGNPIGNALNEISFLVKVRLQGIGLPLSMTVDGEFSGANVSAFLDDFTSRNMLDWFFHESLITVTPQADRVEKNYSFEDQEVALEFRNELDRLLPAHSGFDISLGRVGEAYVVRIDAPVAYQEHSTSLHSELTSAGKGEAIAVDSLASLTDLDDKSSTGAAPRKRVMRFEFKHAWVEDRQIGSTQGQLHFPGVVKILSELVQASRGGVQLAKLPSTGTQASPSAGNAPQSLEAFEAKNVAAPASGQGTQNAVGQQQGAAKYGSAAAALNASNREAPVIAVDTRTNAVLIYDDISYFDFYTKLIADLDRPLQMVELQAMIIDVDKNRIEDLGITWSGKFSKDSSSSITFSGGFATDSTPQLGDINLIVHSDIFLSRLRALNESGSSKVVSQPSVLAMDNHTANIETKDKFYVKVEGNAQAGSALFPVETGTMLNVTPHVIDDEDAEQRRIQLLVSIRDGTINRQAEALIDSLPTISERNINTQAVVYHGESLLIGGQVHTTKSTSDAKVPVLSDLPILGGLFSKSGAVDRELVRMFLLRPNIVEMSFSRSTANEDALPHIDKKNSVLSPTRIHIPPLEGEGGASEAGERALPPSSPIEEKRHGIERVRLFEEQMEVGQPDYAETVRLRIAELAERPAETVMLRLDSQVLLR